MIGMPHGLRTVGHVGTCARSTQLLHTLQGFVFCLTLDLGLGPYNANAWAKWAPGGGREQPVHGSMAGLTLCSRPHGGLQDSERLGASRAMCDFVPSPTGSRVAACLAIACARLSRYRGHRGNQSLGRSIGEPRVFAALTCCAMPKQARNGLAALAWSGGASTTSAVADDIAEEASELGDVMEEPGETQPSLKRKRKKKVQRQRLEDRRPAIP